LADAMRATPLALAIRACDVELVMLLRHGVRADASARRESAGVLRLAVGQLCDETRQSASDH
jgi:hypothetical protein